MQTMKMNLVRQTVSYLRHCAALILSPSTGTPEPDYTPYIIIFVVVPIVGILLLICFASTIAIVASLTFYFCWKYWRGRQRQNQTQMVPVVMVPADPAQPTSVVLPMETDAPTETSDDTKPPIPA